MSPWSGAAARGGCGAGCHGRAVQVDPIKPMLKASRTKHLMLTCDEPFSNVAFKFNLRRYTMVLPWYGHLARGLLQAGLGARAATLLPFPA